MESPYLFPWMAGSPRDQLTEPEDIATAIRAAKARKLPRLPNIPGCRMLRPGDPGYATRLKVYNARTQVAPALFAVCSTAEAVAAVVRWVKDNGLAFAVRSGGHSYEGYSNSSSVVIDIRSLNKVTFDKPNLTVTVGAGATIGDIQNFLKGKRVAFAAGSCPSVGIGGHALGGGYGLLSRAYGLASDNLQSLHMVSAAGATITATKTTNPDLYWACRGGGGGSFGIATEFIFSVHPIGPVIVFGQSWSLPASRALRIIDAWQQWAPVAHSGTTALLKIAKIDPNTVSLRCLGQSIAPANIIDRDLRALERIEPLSKPRTFRTMSFWNAVQYFAGSDPDPAYQKEKSDFVPALTESGMTTLLNQMTGQSSTHIATILNAYGGAIDAMGEGESAFPHRRSIKYMIHYYSGWDSAASTQARVAEANAFYRAMRPHVPGKAYVNYIDADLPNWQNAYWGQNFGRLKAVKRAFDPTNLFHFARSIPL
ncbi:FAD-binding oxidoreductase [Mesorhizobium sp.]|uniref:FAD-binding oxidoreductase n=1 Tax=Mesorhizobium sp. TaxID=1871066 RepID=UPI001202E89F|nr:FAD-binding oxidoreductase [Mesorhizobium sp.]TJV18015.1 MAG: FAD-binding oxidoreductase [Mesorhizobium sp.]